MLVFTIDSPLEVLSPATVSILFLDLLMLTGRIFHHE